MSSFVDRLLEIAGRAVALGAIIGFVVFLWKSDLLKWQMAVILVLTLILVVTTIFAVVMTRALIHHEDMGWGGLVILGVGGFGYVFAPIGFYFIHKLSTSLDIRWPLYVSLILFVVIVVGVYRNK